MAPSPKRIGKYEILEELGRGGFATVYKARDVKLGRLVALKVLRPALSDDPDFVARFEQEARAAAGLKHPHIVTVYDAVQIDGQLIIALQYVEGRTLHDELQTQKSLSFDRALTILEQIASALDYAHQRGIVHRDVKPANILLEETAQGTQATLLDFGLAKALQASTALTSQGTLLGSPEYMAPEQADPDRANEIGPATDRYALGILAYQLLTGRVPFPGNTPATLNAHLNLKPTDPHALCSAVSPQVSVILLKMLAKSPADRYASASGFVQALRSALTPLIPPPPAKPSRWLRGALVGAIVVMAVGVVGYMIGTRLNQPVVQSPTTTGSVPMLTLTVPLATRSVATPRPLPAATSTPTSIPLITLTPLLTPKIVPLSDLAVPGWWMAGNGITPTEIISLTERTDNCHTGSDCLRWRYIFSGSSWGGVMWWPQGCESQKEKIGKEGLTCGINVPAADEFTSVYSLTFWARGELGGEKIEFAVGSEPGGILPTPRRSTSILALHSTWQRYEIDLRDLDLTNAIALFTWIATDKDNPQGAVFYLDDIQLEGVQ